MTDRAATRPSRTIDVALGITLAAAPERVWLALTQRTGVWWRAPWVSHPDLVLGVQLEERPGGLVWEDWGPGEGSVLAHVTAIRRPSLLELAGPLFVPGAVAGQARLTLERRDDDRTDLSVEHVAVGPLREDAASVALRGWRELLDDRLRTQAEPPTAI